jgi:hypothetical protein
MTRLAMVALVVYVFAAPLLAQEANPVTNGGFEALGPDGVPVDWGFLGKVEVTNQAHSGDRALRFIREADEKGETGINRGWEPNTGKQGAMLAVLKGGIRFWYKAVKSDQCIMAVYVIPMSDKPIEDTGEPRTTFVVPDEQAGDGQWHEGALKYDFSDKPRVKWLHVSVRLMGGPGEMLFDDVRYVEHVGPLLTIPRLSLRNDEKAPGERAALKFTIQNGGDEPLAAPQVEITPSAGMQVTAPGATPKALQPEEEWDVACTVTGRRATGSTLRVAARAGEITASRSVVLKPKLTLAGALAEPFLLAPGETTTIKTRVENQGTAVGAGSVALQRVPEGLAVTGHQVKLGFVAPGGSVEETWQVRATRAGELELTAALSGGDKPEATTVRLSVTPAARTKMQQFAQPLWYGTEGGRTVGELRVRKGGEWITVERDGSGAVRRVSRTGGSAGV